jgi:MFS family permease
MTSVSSTVADKRFGWVLVLVTFVLTALCFGGFGLVTVLIKPLGQELGWQRSEIAAAYTIATISTALAGVAFGRISDVYGVRALSALGALTMAACLLLLSRITALWQLYLLYAVFGALGHGAISVPLTAAVSNWFKVSRGLAVGIAMSGSAVGLGIVPLIASTVMADTGWRDAWLYLGLAYLVVGVPLALLVRNPPQTETLAHQASANRSPEQTPPVSPGEALAWTCTAVIFCCICMAIPMIHVPALVGDLGLDVERSASVLTVIMLSGAVGRLIFGRITDRVGPLSSYILASFGQTALVFWFVQAPSLASLYPVAVVFGLCFGGVMTGFLLTIRSLVPTRIAGTAMALVYLFGWIGMGLGGYFGGLFFDWTGTYVTSFALAAAAGAVNIAILIALFVRLQHASPPRLHIGQVQQA